MSSRFGSCFQAVMWGQNRKFMATLFALKEDFLQQGSACKQGDPHKHTKVSLVLEQPHVCRALLGASRMCLALVRYTQGC